MNEWQRVPELVTSLIKEGSTMFMRLRSAVRSLPKPSTKSYGIWFNPKTQAVYFHLDHEADQTIVDDWKDTIGETKGVKKVIAGDPMSPPSKDTHGFPWIRVKDAAVQSVLGPIAQAAGWKSGPIADMFGGPNPLSATIAGGALGAGAGYGLGWLAEKVLPEKYFDKGKLRRLLGVGGGVAGALPGLWAGTINMRHGTGFMDPIGATKMGSAVLDVFINADDDLKACMNKLADTYDRYRDYQDTSGQSFLGAGAPGVEPIEKDRFNRPMWNDPFTPPAIKGMAAGVAEGASQIAGSGSWFQPVNVAQLGASMAGNAAAGWAAGALAGKVMGALAGLNDQGQQALQRTGVWAGLVTATVPKIFGSSGYRNEFYD